MRSKGYFTSRLTKSYDYFSLPDGTADVFIYDLNSVEEVTQRCEENEFVQFRYDMNEFNIDSSVITQEMVAADSAKYLDYEPEKEKTALEMIAEIKEENNMLKECLLEMSELVYQ